MQAGLYGIEGDEEKPLLEHASHPLIKALVIAYVETGCRVGELRGLQWQHVNVTRCVIDLPGAMTKTGRDRSVPYVPKGRLAGILDMRRNDPAGQPLPAGAYVFGNEVGDQIKASALHRDWKRTCEAAKITGLQLRDLLRESASQLLESGRRYTKWPACSATPTCTRPTPTSLPPVQQQRAAMLRRDAHRAISFAQDSQNPPSTPPEHGLRGRRRSR